MSRTLKGQLIPICSWIVMAVSLNLVVGISGELSLGHAGFMSIGAFSGIIASGWLLNGFQMENETLRLILAILVGGLMAGVFGALIGIPVLRLRGDYLAIVTLAFGEIIKNVMNCVYVAVDGRNLSVGFLDGNLPGTLLLNGPNGAVSVSKIATFTAGFILILIALAVILNLMNSRTGRAIMATRDNRIAAESVGISVSKTKTLAFVISSCLAGAAGALYALNYSSFVATKFDFNNSILLLVYVVLGGLGNMSGTIISTALLVVLPEMLRFLQNYRMLIYAIVLIVIMLVSNNEFLKLKMSQLREKIKPKKKGAE
jgi:branched-chain amino acid transport system permease protein